MAAPASRLTCLLLALVAGATGGCSDDEDQSAAPPSEASAAKEPLPNPVERLLGSNLAKVKDYECQQFRPDQDRIESKDRDISLSARAPDRFCRVELTQRTVFFGQTKGEWFRFGPAIEINSTPSS